MAEEVVKPTIEDMRQAYMEDHEDFEEICSEADPSWRHGCYMTDVFKRISDETYWQVSYQRSGDGEYNSLRDGDVGAESIAQVWPHTVTTTQYLAKRP